MNKLMDFTIYAAKKTVGGTLNIFEYIILSKILKSEKAIISEINRAQKEHKPQKLRKYTIALIKLLEEKKLELLQQGASKNDKIIKLIDKKINKYQDLIEKSYDPKFIENIDDKKFVKEIFESSTQDVLHSVIYEISDIIQKELKTLEKYRKDGLYPKIMAAIGQYKDEKKINEIVEYWNDFYNKEAELLEKINNTRNVEERIQYITQLMELYEKMKQKIKSDPNYLIENREEIIKTFDKKEKVLFSQISKYLS